MEAKLKISDLIEKLQQFSGAEAPEQQARALLDALNNPTQTTSPQIRCRFVPESSSGNRKSWAMRVTGIANRTQRGVKAFDSTYLPKNTEIDLPLGALVIEVRPEGSVKNNWQSAWLLTVTEDGLSEVCDLGNWRTDFLSIRDRIESELNGGGK